MVSTPGIYQKVWDRGVHLGNHLETRAPFLAMDIPWFCHLQIYSSLFSLNPKDSPFKTTFLKNCYVLMHFILFDYCFVRPFEQI